MDQMLSAWKRELFNAILMLLLGAAAFGAGVYLFTKTERHLRATGIALAVGGATLLLFGLFAAINS